MLKTDFVPVAIDQWFQRRQKDAEGDFYRKVASQGPRRDFNKTTQGRYVCTPDGKLLGYNNNRGAERLLKVMRQALKEFDPANADFRPIEADKPDPRLLAGSRIPENATVIRVTSKVLGGYQPTEDWTRAFQQSMGRDNLVLTQEDVKQLIEVAQTGGKVSDRIAGRIARFHLADNTRGEAEWWRPEEVKQLNLTIDEGKLKGSAELATADDKRGYSAALTGYIKVTDSTIKQFDLVAEGTAWGRGRFTGFEPKGKFPFAVSFRLADGTDPSDKIPPHGTKGWGRKYYE